MTRIVAGILILLMVTGIVMGQYCAPTPQYTPQYTKPYRTPQYEVVHEVHEVVAPIAVPILVPVTVFQYLPALQPAAIPLASQAGGVANPGVQVQGQGPVQQGPPVSIGQEAPSVQSPTMASDMERLINARIDALMRERLNPGDHGPPVLIITGELPPGPDRKQEAPPQGQQGPPAPKDQPDPKNQQGDLGQQVAKMLSTKSCVRCHTTGGGPVKGNVSLFNKKDNQTVFQPSVSKQKLLAAVIPDKSGKASMPPDGPTLTAQEIDLLRRWTGQR